MTMKKTCLAISPTISGLPESVDSEKKTPTETITISTLGNFELMVLLAVRQLNGNAYGTTILRAVEMAEEREIAIGAMYTTLDRLETKGFVESAKGDPTPERGGRAKRFFTLTAPGEVAIKASLDKLKRRTASFTPVLDIAK